MPGQTPWQTTGPFLHFGLPWKGAADLTGDSDLGARPDLIAPGHDYAVLRKPAHRQRTIGHRVELVGRLFDNTGAPIIDSLVEIWQANAAGRYVHPEDSRDDLAIDPAFIGYGRCASGRDGTFRFRTIRPGRVPGPGNTLQAPHIAVGLMGPGFLKRLVTRIYFPDMRENADDPILALVPEERRPTLIAAKEWGGANLYRFDIHLGGDRETVFFDI